MHLPEIAPHNQVGAFADERAASPLAGRKRERAAFAAYTVDRVAATPPFSAGRAESIPLRIPSPPMPDDFRAFLELAPLPSEDTDVLAARLFIDDATPFERIRALVRMYVTSSPPPGGPPGSIPAEIKLIANAGYDTPEAARTQVERVHRLLQRLENEIPPEGPPRVELSHNDRNVLSEHGVLCLRSPYVIATARARVFTLLARSEHAALPAELFSWSAAYILTSSRIRYDANEQGIILECILMQGAKRHMRLAPKLVEAFARAMHALLSDAEAPRRVRETIMFRTLQAVNGDLLARHAVIRRGVADAVVDLIIRSHARTEHPDHKAELTIWMMHAVKLPSQAISSDKRESCFSAIMRHVVDAATARDQNNTVLRMGLFQYVAKSTRAPGPTLPYQQLRSFVNVGLQMLGAARQRSDISNTLRQNFISTISMLSIKHPEWPRYADSELVSYAGEVLADPALPAAPKAIIAHAAAKILTERGVSFQLPNAAIEQVVHTLRAASRSSGSLEMIAEFEKDVRDLEPPAPPLLRPAARQPEAPPSPQHATFTDLLNPHQPSIFDELDEAALDTWHEALKAEQADPNTHALPFADLSPAQYIPRLIAHFRDGSWNSEFADLLHHTLAMHGASGEYAEQTSATLHYLSNYSLYGGAGAKPDAQRVFEQIFAWLRRQNARAPQRIVALQIVDACALRAVSAVAHTPEDTRILMDLGLDVLVRLPNLDQRTIDLLCSLIDLRNGAGTALAPMQNAALTKQYNIVAKTPDIPLVQLRRIIRALGQESPPEEQGLSPAALLPPSAGFEHRMQLLANITLPVARRRTLLDALAHELSSHPEKISSRDQMILAENFALQLHRTQGSSLPARRAAVSAFVRAEPKLRATIPNALYKHMFSTACDRIVGRQGLGASDAELLTTMLDAAYHRRCNLDGVDMESVLRINDAVQRAQRLPLETQDRLASTLYRSVCRGDLPLSASHRLVFLDRVVPRSLQRLLDEHEMTPLAYVHLDFLRELCTQPGMTPAAHIQVQLDALFARLATPGTETSV